MLHEFVELYLYLLVIAHLLLYCSQVAVILGNTDKAKAQ